MNFQSWPYRYVQARNANVFLSPCKILQIAFSTIFISTLQLFFLRFFTELNSTPIQGKIKGGSLVNEDISPMSKYVCVVRHYRVENFVGVFLSMNRVLTLASAFYYKTNLTKPTIMKIDKQSIEVLFIREWFTGLTVRKVKEIHEHPDYKPETHIHNVAVLSVSYYIKI